MSDTGGAMIAPGQEVEVEEGKKSWHVIVLLKDR